MGSETTSPFASARVERLLAPGQASVTSSELCLAHGATSA
jgi:hypothetical protein